MHILIFPAGFILWYLAYEAKPIFNDEVTLNWEEKNTNNKDDLINYSFVQEAFSKNIKSSGSRDNYTVNKKVLSDNIKMMHEFIEFKYFKKITNRNNNIIE